MRNAFIRRFRERATFDALEPRQLFAGFQVDSTFHGFTPGNGDTTLEDAIFQANTTPGADTIFLQPGATYVLDHVNNTNWGASGLQSIGTEITIEGNGATIMRSTAAGTPDFRIFYVMSADRVSGIFGPGFPVTTPSLTLKNLTLANGSSKGGGGEVGGGGGAGLGGALYNQSLLTLENVLLTNNTAKGGFGGLRSTHVGDGGDFGDARQLGGGGLAANSETGGNGQTGAFGDGGGKGSIGKGGNGQFGAGGGATNSSSDANRGIGGFGGGNGNVSGGAGGGGAGLGGAIFNEGGTLTVSNSTLYANTAAGGSGHQPGHGWGGAIFSLNGTVNLVSNTISDNTAEAGRGVFLASIGGTASMTAYNTIFSQANITASDIAQSGTVQITGDHNMVRNSTAAMPAGFSFSSADPKLGPLVNNDGFSKTLALLAGSPAINAGTNDHLPPSNLDQRGHFRISGGTVDVGAFEVDAGQASSLISINNGSVEEGADGTRNLTFTVVRSGDVSGTGSFHYATDDLTASDDSDYIAQSGTLTFAPGELTKQLDIAVRGDTTPEASETFRVLLSDAQGLTITDGEGIGTIGNDDGAIPAPAISIADASRAEGNSGTSPMLFTVSLSHATDHTTVVNYRTRNVTAGEGDYAVQTGAVTFGPGETTKQLGIAIKGDTKVENDEQFIVELSGAQNITDAQAVGTIVNDDATGAIPVIYINDLDGPELDGGTSQVIFNLTLDRPSTQTVTVAYRTHNQTAGEGDYGVMSGTITFAPGQTSRSLAITIKGDTKLEGDETFAIDLSNPVNASIGDGTGIGTIRNDD